MYNVSISNESIDTVRKIFSFLVFLTCICLTNSVNGTTYTVTPMKMDTSTGGHVTTRTTVRHVFTVDSYWYVFYGTGDAGTGIDPDTYFRTSTDGLNWSGRKTGTGGDVTSKNMASSGIAYGNTFYFCKGENNELRIHSGAMSNGNITWSNGYVVIPSDQPGYGYYPDIMKDTNGHFTISSRHYYLDANDTGHLDPAYIVSTNPDDITSWQSPQNLDTLTLPERIDGHENIPLPGGKRIVIFRTHNGVYESGTPGNFLAFHWDGVNWSNPVDLGNSDGINGSDKRHCAMLDPGTGIVHLLYIKDSGTLWSNNLCHRKLSPPYSITAWSQPVTIDTNVFTVTLGMDTSSDPARVVAIYGDQKQSGDPPWESRLHTGEIYMKWFNGTSWDSGRQLVSEPGDQYAWYPNVSEDASGKFGVLYLKGKWTNKIWDVMFSLVEPGTVINKGTVAPFNIKSTLHCFPNPFNRGTPLHIVYNRTSKPSHNVFLTIHNAKGDLVSKYMYQKTGEVNLIWDGCNTFGKPLCPGVYFIELRNGKLRLQNKVLLVR